MKIAPRSEWGAVPARSFLPSHPVELRGVVVHWFGSPKAAASHAGCPKLLRSVQRSHMAGEFNDVAYNIALCPHGVIYEGRGFNRRSGANGNAKVNKEYGSVVVMMGTGDKLTGEAKASLRDVILEYRKLGAGVEVKRHGEITGSECPGPELSVWVNTKAYQVAPPKKVTKPKPQARIDVEAGSVILRGQNPDAPAVQSRMRKLFARFGRIVISKSKENK